MSEPTRDASTDLKASEPGAEPARVIDPVRAIDPALKGKMLPGVAGIAMFLLFLTLVNVFGALSGAFGPGAARFGILGVCTQLVGGLFGLLRMRRWGWSIVLAGCLLLACGDAYVFSRTHSPFFIVRSVFELIFFLYLVRPEVRDRML